MKRVRFRLPRIRDRRDARPIKNCTLCVRINHAKRSIPEPIFVIVIKRAPSFVRTVNEKSRREWLKAPIAFLYNYHLGAVRGHRPSDDTRAADTPQLICRHQCKGHRAHDKNQTRQRSFHAARITEPTPLQRSSAKAFLNHFYSDNIAIFRQYSFADSDRQPEQQLVNCAQFEPAPSGLELPAEK